VIGPLRRPGEGEQEAQDVIDDNVQSVVDLMNRLRQSAREDMVKEMGSHGSYVSGTFETPSQGTAPLAPQAVSQAQSQVGTAGTSQANGRREYEAI
jgi:hypothetical protein